MSTLSHAPARTYEVRTYGCQMNVHDSERLTGLLEDAGYVAAPAERAGRRGRVQHLRGARERRQQALRQPRPPRAGEGRAPRACRSPSAAAWRRRTARRSPAKAPWVDVVFGTHNIGSLPVLLERARVAGGGAGRDPRVARGVPVDAADQARVGVRRLGVDLGRLQQHLHVLHRPGAARQGEGPPARRDPRRDRGAGRRGRQRGHPARARTSTPTAWSSATGRRSPSCCAPAATIEGLERVRFTSPAPGGVHRRRDRGDGRDPERDAVAAHAAAVRLRQGAQGHAPVLPAVEVPRHHRPGPRRDARRRDHHRHHRRLPRRDRGGLPRDARRSSRAARFSGAFTFQYSKRPGTPAAALADQVAQGGRAGPLRAAGRARQRHRLGREQAARRPHRRADGRRGRGPQGRRHPPALRPRARQPAGALHADVAATVAAVDVRPGRHGRRSRSPTPPRTTWSPTAPVLAVRRTRSGDAWEARTAPSRRASRSGCRRSASPRRCPTRPPAPADARSPARRTSLGSTSEPGRVALRSRG